MDVMIISESIIKVEEVKLEPLDWIDESSKNSFVKQETDHAEDQDLIFTEGGEHRFMKKEVKQEDEKQEELEEPIRLFLDPIEERNGEPEPEDEDPLAMSNENFRGSDTLSIGGESVTTDEVSEWKITVRSVSEKGQDFCKKRNDITPKSAYMKIHGITFTQCYICQRSFPSTRGLAGHMRTHSSISQTSFTQESKLNMIKLENHLGERRHMCSICQMSFTHKCYLRVHMRTHSKHPYKCSVCQRTFNLKRDLDMHIPHHGPHKCSVCEKSFTHKCNFLKHMKIHSGEAL